MPYNLNVPKYWVLLLQGEDWKTAADIPPRNLFRLDKESTHNNWRWKSLDPTLPTISLINGDLRISGEHQFTAVPEYLVFRGTIEGMKASIVPQAYEKPEPPLMSYKE